MSIYISSQVTKYGDVTKVKSDVKILNEIIERQGVSLLIDVMAEFAGQRVLDFKMNSHDRNTLIGSLLAEFNNAIAERT